jgi:hypothetical protein
VEVKLQVRDISGGHGGSMKHWFRWLRVFPVITAFGAPDWFFDF